MNGTSLRLEASIEAMREYFPHFSLSGLPIGTGPTAVWKGWVQPIRSTDHLEELLDDLMHERPVIMKAGGIIEHNPDCAAEHCRHEWMEKVSNPFVEYKLEVQYDGGETHPSAYVRDPVVPYLKRRKHHYTDGSLCAYPSWFDMWRWDRDTVVQFMLHATEWLVKWTVWEQTSVWLGPEKDHNPGQLLREIHPEQQCHCRSGRKYGLCCRSKDEAYAMRNIEAIIRPFLRS
ncbi:MAG: hypothetical protein WCF57_07510 [Pyrinomonadaceae bacterium]